MYTFTTRQSRGKGPFFSTERGQRKRFWGDFLDEEDNHLGNVLVVISDKVKLYSRNKITLDSARAEVVNASDYYPFGLEMKGRQFNEKNYRYGFNTQEKVDEISNSHYTALHWEYDSKIGRRWNVDPVKKPWQSDYAVLSNSPIWKIDPDGDDDFFNADGSFSHSTKTGTEIVVINDKNTMSFSQFSASTNNSDIKGSANIVGFYRRAAGISSKQAVGVSPNTSGLAYSNLSGIWVSTKGGANSLLNDSKNLINTLKHEKIHQDNNDPGKGGDITFQDHLNVYDSQMSDATFKETTNEFKAGMANNYASYLLGGINSGEIGTDKAEQMINDFNTKNKSYGIRISGKNDFGTVELKSTGLTDKGKSIGWQPVEAKKDAR